MDIDTLHASALAQGARRYRDPATGYGVFTALGLEARGECCGAGCRHCPFAHAWVPDILRGDLVQDPWMEGLESGSGSVDVLCWSGGAKAFLALQSLAEEAANEVVLLASFDGRSLRMEAQGLGLEDIRRQARAMEIGLVAVPLYPERRYSARVALALRRVAARRRLARVVFGDVGLQHVRSWREQQLGAAVAALGASLHFPLWEVPPAVLEARLWASGAAVHVSAVDPEKLGPGVSVGDRVDADWMDALPQGVDRMGGQGEFHTRVTPPPGGWRALSG